MQQDQRILLVRVEVRAGRRQHTVGLEAVVRLPGDASRPCRGRARRARSLKSVRRRGERRRASDYSSPGAGVLPAKARAPLPPRGVDAERRVGRTWPRSSGRRALERLQPERHAPVSRGRRRAASCRRAATAQKRLRSRASRRMRARAPRAGETRFRSRCSGSPSRGYQYATCPSGATADGSPARTVGQGVELARPATRGHTCAVVASPSWGMAWRTNDAGYRRATTTAATDGELAAGSRADSSFPR